QAETAKAQVLARRVADVASRRQALTSQYGMRFPTFEDLYSVLSLVPTIAERVSDSDKAAFLDQARSLGFNLAESNGEICSDFNTFKNNKGYELETSRVKGKDGDLIYAIELKFPNAPQTIINLYAAELRANFREMRKSTVDLTEDVPVLTKSPMY